MARGAFSRTPAPVVRPLATAVGLSLLYAALAGAHIVYSSEIAAEAAESVKSLERLEIEKGLGFVVVTAAVFFVFAWLVLRRVARQEQRLFEQQDALVASERHAMTAVFAASIAHDVNNVLTIAYAQADRLGRPELAPEERGRSSASLAKALRDLAALSKRLVSFEREKDPEHRERADLGRVVRESVEFSRHHVRVRSCRMSAAIDGAIAAEVDVTVLRRMLLNLILNAADATEGKGRIELRMRREGESVRIEVHDDGPGVPRELRDRIFDVFYTSKTHGTGLGLLSVRVAAEEHGGTVEVLDSDLGGACFRVTLPLGGAGA